MLELQTSYSMETRKAAVQRTASSFSCTGFMKFSKLTAEQEGFLAQKKGKRKIVLLSG